MAAASGNPAPAGGQQALTDEYLLGISDGVNPFDGSATWGDLRTHDDTDTTMFTMADVAEVLHEGSSGETWDGTVAAVIRLRDGRFVAWETFYGPTGDGFHEDAYGGDADVTFGSTLDSVIRWGLTDEGRNILGIPHPEGPPPAARQP